MNWVTVIKDCGLQVIIAAVFVVQFFITLYLRRRVRALEHYEDWYFHHSQQYQSPTQPVRVRYSLPRPKELSVSSCGVSNPSGTKSVQSSVC
jgi:hypothetical protein